jgi:hypothetical protein
MKKSKLSLAVSFALTAAAIGAATPAYADQTVYYPPSTTSVAATEPAGVLPGSFSVTGSVAIFAWDGSNNSVAGKGWGWGHNAKWVLFDLSSAASLDINLSNAGGGSAYFSPAFTLWSTNGYTNPGDVYGNGHSFSQVSIASAAGAGPAPWLTATNEGGVSGFIGYANAGPTGWVNAAGLTVNSGAELNGTGYVNTVTTTAGSDAQLLTNVLPAGEYLMAVGGSYACGNFLSNNLASCAVNSGSGNFALTITQSAVPLPSSIWLFGSVVAGALGRRSRSKIARL